MRNKLIMIVFVISGILLIAGGMLSIFYKANVSEQEEKPVENTEVPSRSVVNFTGNVVKVDDNAVDLFSILLHYGETMYADGSYINYPKDSSMHFISLQKLKEDFDCDISKFKDSDGNVCNMNESGIYFDTENYLKLEEPQHVVPVLVGCYNTK